MYWIIKQEILKVSLTYTVCTNHWFWWEKSQVRSLAGAQETSNNIRFAFLMAFLFLPFFVQMQTGVRLSM